MYGLGSIIPRVLNFLLVPLHTINVFSRAEYGTITKLYAFAAVLNVVFMFGMETAFFRFATRDGADPKRVFNLAQTVVLLISISFSISFIGFAAPLAGYFEIPGHPEVIRWLAVILLTDAAVAIPFARLRLENKALRFASLKIINVLLLLILNVYFLKIAYDPSVNIGYVFLANLIANAGYLLFFFRTLASWRPAFDREITPAIVRYAYPVMLTGVAGMVNEMFSRTTLDWWLPDRFYGSVSNQEAMGIFGACYKYAVFMNLGVQAFRYAAEPFFFSQAANKNSPELFARVNHYFIIVCCFFFVAISVNLDILKYFIGQNFWDGMSIVPILLMAYLFLGIYYNISIWFKLKDMTHYGTLITLAGAGVTVAGNYFLIPVAGYEGSSWAAFLCYFTMAVLCYLIGRKFYPIPYRLIPALGYLAFSIALVLCSQWMQFSGLFASTIFHLLLILVFVSAVWLFEQKRFRKET